ncbi:ribonuclease Z [Candidatus Woesearchaeota archaeon]|nr:ribonuclease Z [Candidatus Woesearchaeota archaeon]
MELLFLGTSSMVPTKERNHSAILLTYGAENILLDCGEGTQRQLKMAGVASPKITKILISHWHGDHVLGLPGLLQTISASEYSKILEIYGPRGTKKHFEYIKKAFFFEEKFEVKVREIEEDGIFFENEDFCIEAKLLEHTVPCLGYRFSEKAKRKIKVDAAKKLGIPQGPLLGKLQEGKSVTWKGKKIMPEQVTYEKEGKSVAFILDTVMCESCVGLAKDADILVCEATYSEELEHKAEEYKHLTAKSAAMIANRANVKQLVITHFSPRYKNPEKLAEEARNYFDKTLCAKDFMRIRV